MAILTIHEILDLVIMVAAVGFIFKNSFSIPKSDYDPLEEFKHGKSFFDDGFRNAIIVAAPAVVLHEAGHKIVALMFGLTATFHAAYEWLAFGVVLKLFNAPFVFFVPGYVSYSGHVGPLGNAMIAFAGPLVNLLLFLFATLAIKQRWFKAKHAPYFVLTKQVNLFLFIFNMLPFGFFDGSQLLDGVISLLR